MPDMRAGVPESVVEESSKCLDVLCLTFPDHDDSPAKLTQLPASSAVAFNILPELVDPEVNATLRCICISATTVPVPEAAVDKEGRLISG